MQADFKDTVNKWMFLYKDMKKKFYHVHSLGSTPFGRASVWKYVVEHANMEWV